MEPLNHPPSSTEFSLLKRILIWIGAGDEDLLHRCSPRDTTNICALALLMIAVLLYQGALFFLIGEQLFDQDGQKWPYIIFASLSLAAFIMLIDRYAVVLTQHHQEGLSELVRGGVELRKGIFLRVKLAFFLIVRIGILSVGLAQLCGLFVSLLIFSGDIGSYLQHKYLTENAAVIARQTEIVDAEITRATNAVKNEAVRAAALSAQVGSLRQEVIDPSAGDPAIQLAQREVESLEAQRERAEATLQSAQSFAADEYGGIRGFSGNSGHPGIGPRYRAALQKIADAKAQLQDIEQQLNNARARLDALRSHAASDKGAAMQHAKDELPSFQKTLGTETTKLASLKDQLARLIANRNAAIRTAVAHDPNLIPYDGGFRERLFVLERIAEGDKKIAVVIILVDVVSFGLELSAVLARVTAWAPTTFAALLAEDVLMSAVHIAEEMMAEFKAIDGKNANQPPVLPERPGNGSPQPSESTIPPADGAQAAQPGPAPKRKRGRPPKHLKLITGGNGQEPPKPQQDP